MKRPRIRLEPVFRRHDVTTLTIDNLQFTLSQADLLSLGEQLAGRLVQLEARARPEPTT